MTHKEQICPWCVIRPFPNLQQIIVARFRRRADAEAYLQILQRLVPDVAYQIIFDTTPDYAGETARRE